MIPHTFPTLVDGITAIHEMVIYKLADVTGLMRWVDYIPIKTISDSVSLQETYNSSGYQPVHVLANTTGQVAWTTYIPCYEDAAATVAWGTGSDGYIPVANSVSRTATTDPYFANVTSLLHFDGNLTDVKGVTWTANGNAAATGDPKFGTKSLALDGSGDYLRAGTASIAEFGTGDWTVEMWVYANGVDTNGENFFDTRSANIAAAYVLGVTGAGALKVYDGVAERTGSGTFTAGQWNHIAYGVASNRLYMHLNGTKVYDQPTAVTFTGAAAPALVWPFGGTQDLAGRIDEFRITKGVCRYTADFTAPTAAFPDS